MGVIPFLLALGAAPAVAAPVYYVIDFTLTSGSPLPASGSFSYDASTSTFASFVVLWDGDSFDLTAAANASPFLSFISQPCITTGAAGSGPHEVFNLMTNCPSAYWDANLAAVSPTDPSFLFDQGVVNTGPSYGLEVITPGQPIGPPTTAGGGFTTSVAPEPGTWALTLIGLGVALRKRVPSALRFSRAGRR